MKNCKICWALNENPLLKFCKKCYYEVNDDYSKKKPMKQISDKRKERILNWWSEKEVFREIWNERKHECENCWKVLKEAKAHNFDHIIPKSRWEKYRLDKENIKVVCFACHFLKTTWLNYKWPDLD